MAAGPAGGTAVGNLADGGQIRRAAELLSDRMHGITGPVTAAFATSFRLSHRVLRGNVASALAGASAMLAGSCPPRAGTAERLTAQVLAVEPPRGTGEFVQPDPAVPRLEFMRHSCCLLYRVPGAGTCGDCVLTAGKTAGAGLGRRAAGEQPVTRSRLPDRAYPIALSNSARAPASEGPYQVSSRPETSTTRWARNSSGPSSELNG